MSNIPAPGDADKPLTPLDFKQQDGVTYIKAEQRSHLGEFLAKVTKATPLVKWEFGETYDPGNGWMVVWQVGPLALMHKASWAREFVKDLRRRNSPNAVKKARQAPWAAAKRKAFDEMAREWEQWANRVGRRNMHKESPFDVDALAEADAQARHDARIAAQESEP